MIFTYEQTRRREVLRAAAENNRDELLRLAVHHLGTACRSLETIHWQETVEDTAYRVLMERVRVADLILTTLSMPAIFLDDANDNGA